MGASITIENVNNMIGETDPAKQKEMSEKIFKAMDVNQNGSLDKKEMMGLVEVFWNTYPWVARKMMGAVAGSEAVAKKEMDEELFKDLDTNSDGMVTFEEWQKAVSTGILKANMEKNNIA